MFSRNLLRLLLIFHFFGSSPTSSLHGHTPDDPARLRSRCPVLGQCRGDKQRRARRLRRRCMFFATHKLGSHFLKISSQSLPRIDALSSRLFLLTVLPRLSRVPAPHLPMHEQPEPGLGPTRALDCGAGIGRVTSSVLLPLLDRVDLVEPSVHFVQRARRLAPSWPRISSSGSSSSKNIPQSGVRTYQAGLQDFDPRNPGKSPQLGDTIGAKEGWEDGYDVVWIQWCAGHLSDEQFVSFLKRSKSSLREDGIIVVKENQTRLGLRQALFDEDDSTLTR
jgi:protein N-terminal methyltransferase